MAPEVNVARKKFGIKVEVPSIDGMGQFHLLCDNVSLSLVASVFVFVL